MNFVSISSAWLFALLLPLVIFYFLKLKRPRQTIPSLALWRQVLSDQRVNSPFQRFKRNILLLLQMLLLTLLVLAAMQPFLRRAPSESSRLPILIDVSASMAALDRPNGTSRLDEAKAQLLQRIDSMPSDQELCLIAFSKSARRLTPFTNNQRELRDAVKTLQVEDVPGALDEALRVAQALARTSPFDRVHVITDGNLPSKSTFELPFQLALQKLPPAGPNVGITGCNARRTPAGQWELLVQLACTDPAPANTASIVLTSGETEIAREQISLEAGGTPRLAFKVTAANAAGDSIRVSLQPGGFDSLASDNTAWLTLPASRALDVYVENSLATFRHALSGVEGIRLFPAADMPSPSSYDLAIGSAAQPARVSCTMGELPVELKGLVNVGKSDGGLRAIDWRRDSPLLLHVSFDEVLFLDDPVTASGKDHNAFRNLNWEPMVDGPHGPLMLLKQEDNAARVHLLFTPEQSTLPFRVAFPIFCSNLVQLAMQMSGQAEIAAPSTGVLPPFTATPSATVSVKSPTGASREEKANERGMVTGVPATRAGEYTFTAGSTSTTLGASLLSFPESTLVSVDEVGFGDQISVPTDSKAPKADRSLWWLLAALGYSVLLLEWWWFQRKPF